MAPWGRLLGLCAVLAVAGCETMSAGHVYSVLGSAPAPADATPGARPRGEAARTAPRAEPPADVGFVRRGTGVFARAPAPGPAARPPGDVTLNFENTSLLEVVKVVLADLLGESYVIDPGVQGTVTLQTTRPLRREDLLPTLEMLLRANGAALVRGDGLYHVVPRELAAQGLVVPQLGDTDAPLPPGFGVRVVPLRYVAAAEMQKILEPFSAPGNVVRVDSERNLLVLAGTAGELENLLETVRVFDVDWMAGQSMALFTPRHVDAKTLAEELDAVFGRDAEGATAGLLRVVPIERLGAVLVVSASAAYVDKAAEWVERLDRDTGSVGQRLFVYHVQNGKAVDLAAVLGEVFTTEAPERAPPPELAPGLEPAALRSEPAPGAAPGEPASAPAPAPARPALPARPARGAAGATAESGVSLTATEGVKIIADEVNNALLVLATAEQYQQVEQALRALDIVPLQVLIEATIAEVTLTGELSQGLEWFFKNHIGSKAGIGTLDLGQAGLAALAPGFSYAITDSADVVRAVLNVLAEDSRANIVSSPSLMVLNNQKATINVGDQVPITTQQQQATVATSTVVNNIEFRDTGVLLTVTPRVNAGGLVIMEVEQEVSNVAPGDADTLTPTIQQRKISSTVAVHSGETIVLGGLIRENKSRIASGIPGLYTLPVIGTLFGRSTDSATRTELVVLITPRAVQGIGEARAVTEEFRTKMRSLRPLAPARAPPGAPAPGDAPVGGGAPAPPGTPAPGAPAAEPAGTPSAAPAAPGPGAGLRLERAIAARAPPRLRASSSAAVAPGGTFAAAYGSGIPVPLALERRLYRSRSPLGPVLEWLQRVLAPLLAGAGAAGARG